MRRSAEGERRSVRVWSVSRREEIREAALGAERTRKAAVEACLLEEVL